LNKQYATFPAVSAAWRVGEESFMKNVPAISELKLRGSYGVSGNNNIGDYNSQSYATQVNYVFGTGNASPVFGFSPSSLANTDLTWETNKQTDIAIEIGLLSDRIYFSGRCLSPGNQQSAFKPWRACHLWFCYLYFHQHWFG
jgi:hypothetical protein